jgi:osmotically-inducible protein OsmY
MTDNLLIKNKVKYFLDNHPLVDSSAIDVFVYKGEVTLVGTVTDSKQKSLIEYLVKQIGEVKNVISKIELSSEAITLRLPPIESIFQNQSVSRV